MSPQREDRRSPEAKAYRALYMTDRWKARRRQQLLAEPHCRMCQAINRVTRASIADHVIPHKGDPDLFWGGELQSLCKPHHDSTKQAEEKRGFSGAVDAGGWPIDPRHRANRRSA